MSDGIATGQQGAKMHVAVKGLVNELYLDDLRDKTAARERRAEICGRAKLNSLEGQEAVCTDTRPLSPEAARI